MAPIALLRNARHVAAVLAVAVLATIAPRSFAGSYPSSYIPTTTSTVSVATTQSVNPADVGQFTFTRAAGKYAPDSTGKLVWFASGVPAITDLGISIEGAATNLLLQSTWPVGGAAGQPPTGWSGSGVGSGFASVASAYGANEGAYTFTANNDRPFLVQTSPTLSASTTYTWSVLVEANPNGLTIGQLLANSNGPVGWTSSYPQGNTFVPTAGTRIYQNIVIGTTAGTTQLRVGVGIGGAAAASATLSRPQLEAGSFASSYIPTTTASATRPADVASYGGLSVPSAFTIGAAGSFAANDNVEHDLFSLGVDANNVVNFNRASSNAANFLVRNGGATQLNSLVAGFTGAQSIGAVVSFGSGSYLTAVNGSAQGTASSVTAPALTTLRLGDWIAGGAAWSGTIRNLDLYPYAANSNETPYRSAGNF